MRALSSIEPFSIGGGKLNVNFIPGQSGTLTYKSPNSNYITDLSALEKIIMDFSIVSGTGNIKLTLTDIDDNSDQVTNSVTTGNQNTEWDMTSFNSLDLTKIKEIKFEFTPLVPLTITVERIRSSFIPQIIFDDFAVDQNGISTMNPTSSTEWSPSTFDRSYGSSVVSSSNGILTVTGSIGPGINLRYFNTSSPVDLSTLVTITMYINSYSHSTGTVGLKLTDNNNNSYSVTKNITNSTKDVTWNTNDFSNNNVNLSYITEITFDFLNIRGILKIAMISTRPICVAKDTMILMADGTEKPIQEIKRGDLVAGDLERKTVYKVARVLHTIIPKAAPLKIVKFSKDSLGKDLPHRDLITTSGHQLLYKNVRKRTLCFRKIKGVEFLPDIPAEKVLPLNEDGFFVANGVVVCSLPVKSQYSPLPKEMFFNPELYDKKTEDELPKLDLTILDTL